MYPLILVSGTPELHNWIISGCKQSVKLEHVISGWLMNIFRPTFEAPYNFTFCDILSHSSSFLYLDNMIILIYHNLLSVLS